MNNPEHQLQVACVRYFRYQYQEIKSLLFAVPNGGTRFKREAVKLKAEGVLSGVSDLLLLVPCGQYHGMAIEMKVKPNKATPAQIAFQNDATEQGYYCTICYTFEEFKSEIENYLNQ